MGNLILLLVVFLKSLKTLLLALSIILCSGTALAEVTEPVKNEAKPKTQQDDPKKQKNNVIKVEETELKREKKSKQNSNDKKAERFVMPFTRWVEGKLQGSSVVNPTAQKAKKAQTLKSQHTLRTAIKQALAQYPGTVLSADKTKLASGLEFKIKILSKDGVVRIITIQSDDESDKGNK